jgi:ATPase involved in DNA repair
VQRRDANPEAELTPPEMKLLRLSDAEVLATTSQQVCARITEITGMNFRNFTRSILLAQGDFAAFLNALDSERMDILEKIVSADIYTDYKIEVIEKAAEAQQRLDYLKQDLAVIPVMEPLKREASEHDLADFIEQSAELKKEQSSLKQQQAVLQNVVALQNRITDQENTLSQIKAQAETELQKLARLATAQDALLYEDDVRLIKEKHHALDQDQATLTAFRGELKQIQELIGAVQATPNELPNKSATEQGQTITDLRTQIGLLTTQRQSETDLWQSLGVQVDEKTSTLASVSKWLEEHVADETLLTSFPETAKLKNLRAELTALKENKKLSLSGQKTPRLR